MNIFNKLRWRLEKYAFDPLVKMYLSNRLFQKNNLENPPTVFSIQPRLSALDYKLVFQCMATSQDMEFLWEKNFVKAFEYGLKNDPVNIKQKEKLRYRLYINLLVARLAASSGGGYVTVGVSWGIVPKMIHFYLNKNSFWGSRNYYLIDKYERILFATQGNQIQENYCGDISFIKKCFQDKCFKIIEEYAPKGLNFIDSKISFLHLNTGDKNAEYESVKYMYDKMTRPGYILIDNYYYQKKEDSIDHFVSLKGDLILPLGNSQAIIVVDPKN